jgi:hypothetical protein
MVLRLAQLGLDGCDYRFKLSNDQMHAKNGMKISKAHFYQSSV